MANIKEKENPEMPLPKVVDAKLKKDAEKNWLLSIHTEDGQKLKIHPTPKDIRLFFAKSKGKTQSEAASLRRELAVKYLPQALAMPQDQPETEKMNSVPNRSKEDIALEMFAEQMIEKIESIQQDWKKPWFTEGALGWPKNMNNRPYNGCNSLMLMMAAEKHGYKLPIWCTFDRVMNLNFTKDKQGSFIRATDDNGEMLPKVSVNKGEKSMPVFITTFSVVNPETKEKIPYDDYKQLAEEEKAKYKVYPKLQVYNVFNVAQTNIEQARPELYNKLLQQNGSRPLQQKGEDFAFPAIDTMIADNKWICPIKPTYGDEAYYSISKKYICIPEKKQFIDGESFYSNLFHEIAHSTGAEDQLGRLKPATFGSSAYAKEEMVAELTAALTSQKYGLKKHVKEDSCAYLKNWLDSLKEDPSFIKTVLMDVKKASSMISQRVDKINLELGNKVDEEAVQTETKSVKASTTEVKEQNTKEQEATKVAKSAGSTLKEQSSNLEEIGEYEIPEWSLPYLQNGEDDSLDDDEVEMVDNFIDKEMKGKQYIMVVDWNSAKEFSNSPAFGPRNPNALPEYGESPYQATKTYNVKFMEVVKREQTVGNEDKVARLTPVEEPKEEKQEAEKKEEHHLHRGR